MVDICPIYVKSEGCTAVAMNCAVVWDMASCRSCEDRIFVGSCRLHLHGTKNKLARSSTNIFKNPTQNHSPEDDTLSFILASYLMTVSICNFKKSQTFVTMDSLLRSEIFHKFGRLKWSRCQSENSWCSRRYLAYVPSVPKLPQGWLTAGRLCQQLITCVGGRKGTDNSTPYVCANRYNCKTVCS